MESSRLGYWLQVGANIGILLGLVFVGLQIQQDRELKRVEMVSRMVTDLFERELAAIGDEPYRAIVKAASNPEELTEEEIYVYQTYLNVILLGWHRRKSMEQNGLFDSSWQETTGIPVEAMTKPGAKYLAERLESGYFPKALSDRLLADVRNPDFANRFQQYLTGRYNYE